MKGQVRSGAAGWAPGLRICRLHSRTRQCWALWVSKTHVKAQWSELTDTLPHSPVPTAGLQGHPGVSGPGAGDPSHITALCSRYESHWKEQGSPEPCQALARRKTGAQVHRPRDVTGKAFIFVKRL